MTRATAAPPAALPAAVFLAAGASVGFEVLLLRLFSITLWHHFAAMAVSLAMLGLAASGTALAVLVARRGRLPPPRPWFFLLHAVCIAGSALAAAHLPFDPVRVSWDRSQLLLLALIHLTLAVPFFFAGLITATALAAHGAQAGLIYGADLAGAAAGSVLAVLALRGLSPEQAILLCAGAATGGAFLLGGRAARAGAAALLVLFLAGAAAPPAWLAARITPSKELPTLLRFEGARTLRTVQSPHGRVDLFRSPGVRYAPGLSLRWSGRLPDQVGIAWDGGAVTAATLPGPPAAREFVTQLPAALPFLLREGAEVLLIDPRGGLPALLARRYGARRVACVESNPAVAEAVRGLLGPDAPCGGSWDTGFGRLAARAHPGGFDVIDLPLTGASPLVSYGGGEDYALTTDALRDYLAGLKEEGLLSLSLFLNPPYRAELRLVVLALRALADAGAGAPPRHLVAVRSLESLVLLVRRTPFTDAELDTVRAFARERWFDPVWLAGRDLPREEPHIRTAGADLAAACAALADPRTRGEFIRGYPFDLTPVDDERPFFHAALRLDRLGEVYRMVQRRWDFFLFQGYLLPAVLLQALALGAPLLAAPALLLRGARGAGATAVFAYFALLGTAYLVVEIALLQKLILPLGTPLAAGALVIGTLLVGSGLGSLAGDRVRHPRPGAAALAAAAASLAFAAGASALAAAVSGLPPPARAPVLTAALLPLGALMGLPFPWGMRVLAARAPALIPWAWAANGFFSVVAPLCGALLATKIGFSAVLVLGAAAYLGAALAGRRLPR